jgi:hypothetical protein
MSEEKMQFNQECAIIPLSQFNEMKNNEEIFFRKLSSNDFYGFEERDSI